MKKALAVALLSVTTAFMAIATKAEADFIQGHLNPVRFFVVDDNSNPSPDGDDAVTLSGGSFIPDGWALQWSDFAGGPWADVGDLGAGLKVDTGSDDWNLVYFRITKNGSVDNTANLTFFGSDGDLWNNVRIEWDETGLWYTSFSFLTPGDNDNVAPVPLFASAFLLGSGLIGLVGIRRKFRN